MSKRYSHNLRRRYRSIRPHSEIRQKVTVYLMWFFVFLSIGYFVVDFIKSLF